MAEETLKYVTLDTLKTYDGKLKDWTKGKVDSGIKAIELDTSVTTDGYLKTYDIKYTDFGGEKGSLGKIDIPKDFLVKSGSVVTFESNDDAAAEKEGLTAGTYIKLILNVKQGEATDEAIYINVANLYSDYKAEEDAVQIQLAISDKHVISAVVKAGSITVTELGNDAVETAKIKDANVTTAKIATGAVTGGTDESGATGSIAAKTIVDGNIADATITRDKIAEAFEKNIADLEAWQEAFKGTDASDIDGLEPGDEKPSDFDGFDWT